MTRARFFCFLVVSMFGLCSQGCGGFDQQHSKPPAEKPAVLLDRYELHDIYNGGFHGTALLDKETGQVWTLATSETGGHVTSVDFEKADILPSPGTETCPPNDPVGLFQPQPCTPLPPQKGNANGN
jgi:hypothetical protein